MVAECAFVVTIRTGNKTQYDYNFVFWVNHPFNVKFVLALLTSGAITKYRLSAKKTLLGIGISYEKQEEQKREAGRYWLGKEKSYCASPIGTQHNVMTGLTFL